jgi:hypothetical protein
MAERAFQADEVTVNHAVRLDRLEREVAALRAEWEQLWGDPVHVAEHLYELLKAGRPPANGGSRS